MTDTPKKPQPLQVQNDNLPDTLTQEAKFCCWKYEIDNKRGKWNKVPYNPKTGGRGRSTDPGTFTDYQTAAAACRSDGYDGIGIGIFGNMAAIDIDRCVLDGGQLTEDAADIVRTMQTYTEKSPSGTGVRIIFRLPADFSGYDEGRYYKNRPGSGIEVYIPGHTSRYVTITGGVIGEARQVEERGPQVLEVLEKYMLRTSSRTGTADEERTSPATAGADRRAGGMTRDEARQEIRRSWRLLLQGWTGPAREKVNGETSYICPVCGNGWGKDGDGLTRNPKSRDGNGLKCFKCGFSGDVIDLYQQAFGVDYSEAFSVLADELGLEVIPYSPTEGSSPHSTGTHGSRADAGCLDWSDAIEDAGEAAGERTEAAGAAHERQDGADGRQGINMRAEGKTVSEAAGERTEAKRTDYLPYYRDCRSRITDPAAAAYLEARGISPATAAAYWIGYDPQADPASAPGGSGKIRHPAPRIIIPTTRDHYIARAIDPDTPGKYVKMNPKDSHPGVFNGRVLHDEEVQEVFVVEGVFDALAIIEAGAAAVALNSTDNAGKLVKRLQEERTDATLILCLDNDDAGKKGVKTLREGLQRLSIGYITADICGGYKDPNEYLQQDRAGFVSAVQQARRQTAARPDCVGYYIDNLMSAEIEAFRKDIKTGFKNLDQASGGLYPGLYVVAAISSLGKTTFVHQIADQVAAAGTDVLFFSLEMSRLEMVSKSLARITAQEDLENAVTSLSIRKGYLPKNVLDAAAKYQQDAGERMNVIEGNFSCSITLMRDYIRRYVSKTGTKPLVIIDYLQIVTPEEVKGRPQTTKEVVDATITQLKRLSREYGLPIIAISSVNRANYLTPISFESLKESGCIEFSSDVVWGLQLRCLAEPLFQELGIVEQRATVDAEKAANPRRIILSCIKNRYGIANYTCSFKYYPANDLFVPIEDDIISRAPRKAGRKIGG